MIRKLFGVRSEKSPPVTKHLGKLTMTKRPDLGDNKYEIEKPISFSVKDSDGRKYRITCLKGFIFDGASIPWIFWTLVGSPFTGRYVFAALMHDVIFGCEYFPREVCNWMMLEEMQKDGCWWITRNLIWSGIKVGSWTVWNRHTPQTIAECREHARKFEIVQGGQYEKSHVSHRHYDGASIAA